MTRSELEKRERASVICIHEGEILVFVGVDPTSGQTYYLLPGGAIEPGETEVECATRETWEETGYHVIVDPGSRLTKQYKFVWNGQTYDCTTHFYRARLGEKFHLPLPVADQDYNKGATWVQTDKIHKIFDYTAEIQEAVLALSN